MKKTAETITARQRRAKRRYFTAMLTLALCAAMTCPAFAASGSDPLTMAGFSACTSIPPWPRCPWRPSPGKAPALPGPLF